MQYSVRAGALVGYEQLVAELGGNPASMLRAVGLSPNLSHAPEVHIPYSVLADLYSHTAATLGRADFGWLLGERQGLEVLGAIGSAACLQTDMHGALSMLQRSLGFHARGINFEMTAAADTVVLSFGFDFEDVVDCTQLAAVSTALAAGAVRQLRGGQSTPSRFVLVQPRPDGMDAPAVHGCKIEFGGTSNALHYPPELLALPVEIEKSAQQSLDHAWQSSATGNEDLDLEYRLRAAIESLLPTGECQLPLVARLVGASPRVLQMQLAERGTSFESILRASRERLAKTHLRLGDMSVTELALNLSYNDTTAFSRAFKTWTGASPRAWKKLSGEVG